MADDALCESTASTGKVNAKARQTVIKQRLVCINLCIRQIHFPKYCWSRVCLNRVGHRSHRLKCIMCLKLCGEKNTHAAAKIRVSTAERTDSGGSVCFDVAPWERGRPARTRGRGHRRGLRPRKRAGRPRSWGGYGAPETSQASAPFAKIRKRGTAISPKPRRMSRGSAFSGVCSIAISDLHGINSLRLNSQCHIVKESTCRNSAPEFLEEASCN